MSTDTPSARQYVPDNTIPDRPMSSKEFHAIPKAPYMQLRCLSCKRIVRAPNSWNDGMIHPHPSRVCSVCQKSPPALKGRPQ